MIDLQQTLNRIWPGWTIEETLGEGASGKVYRIIRKDKFGHQFTAALKVITVPQSEQEYRYVIEEGMGEQYATEYFYSVVEDVVDEIVLMSQLKGNSNIVSYEDHTIIKSDDNIRWNIFIRMELLTPLHKYMKEHELSVQDVINLGIDMCNALEACQNYNIIHRDIKPDNIFVSDMGKYKLGDFGIARKLDKTRSGLSQKGTSFYMAPEVYKGEAYNSTIDIYSLGIVLYRLLNYNRGPFLPPYPEIIHFSDREVASMLRLSGQEPPYPAKAKGRLGEVVLKACSYEPKNRYQTPAAMRQALKDASSEEVGNLTNPMREDIEDQKKADKSPEKNNYFKIPEDDFLMPEEKHTAEKAYDKNQQKHVYVKEKADKNYRQIRDDKKAGSSDIDNHTEKIEKTRSLFETKNHYKSSAKSGDQDDQHNTSNLTEAALIENAGDVITQTLQNKQKNKKNNKWIYAKTAAGLILLVIIAGLLIILLDESDTSLYLKDKDIYIDTHYKNITLYDTCNNPDYIVDVEDPIIIAAVGESGHSPQVNGINKIPLTLFARRSGETTIKFTEVNTREHLTAHVTVDIKKNKYLSVEYKRAVIDGPTKCRIYFSGFVSDLGYLQTSGLDIKWVDADTSDGEAELIISPGKLKSGDEAFFVVYDDISNESEFVEVRVR